MRRSMIAGNWKMNTSIAEAVELATAIAANKVNKNNAEVVICPPFTHLSEVCKSIAGSDIKVGAQNMYTELKGAYTGEISASMIKDTGCKYVIIGHSERRQYFKESSEFLNKKINVALDNDLIPIFCIGEILEEREADKTLDVIKQQLSEGLKGMSPEQIAKVVIAYEPVWAIGTGKTATPEQAQEVHVYIRKLIGDLATQEVADNIIILYGGSMKPENVTDLMSQPDIDGGLIGGASLKADSFIQIINY